MRTLLIILFVFVGHSICAQVSFHRNFKVAKAIALEKDQLILLDFWATWCGPCRTMDADLWYTKEATEASKNFVPFKVDVDIERSLAKRYGASSIPKVILITADGERVWEKTGFGGPEPFIEVLKQIPNNLNGLNAILNEDYDKNDANQLMEIAQVYQSVGFGIENELGEEFLSISNSYFRKAEKKTNNDAIASLAELNQLFNDALKGRSKKALKKLEKIDIAKGDKKSQEFKKYITAYCYKCQGEDKKYEKEKRAIESEEYISKLESIQPK